MGDVTSSSRSLLISSKRQKFDHSFCSEGEDTLSPLKDFKCPPLHNLNPEPSSEEQISSFIYNIDSSCNRAERYKQLDRSKPVESHTEPFHWFLHGKHSGQPIPKQDESISSEESGSFPALKSIGVNSSADSFARTCRWEGIRESYSSSGSDRVADKIKVPFASRGRDDEFDFRRAYEDQPRYPPQLFTERWDARASGAIRDVGSLRAPPAVASPERGFYLDKTNNGWDPRESGAIRDKGSLRAPPAVASPERAFYLDKTNIGWDPKESGAIRDKGNLRAPPGIASPERAVYFDKTNNGWELPSVSSREHHQRSITSFMTILSERHCKREERNNGFLQGEVYATYESTTTANTAGSFRPKSFYKNTDIQLKKESRGCFGYPVSDDKSLEDIPVRDSLKLSLRNRQRVPTISECSEFGNVSEKRFMMKVDVSDSRLTAKSCPDTDAEQAKQRDNRLKKWVLQLRESIESKTDQHRSGREKRDVTPVVTGTKTQQRKVAPKTSAETLSDSRLVRRPRERWRWRTSPASSRSSGEREDARNKPSSVERQGRQKHEKETASPKKSHSPRKDVRRSSPESSRERDSKQRGNSESPKRRIDSSSFKRRDRSPKSSSPEGSREKGSKRRGNSGSPKRRADSSYRRKNRSPKSSSAEGSRDRDSKGNSDSAKQDIDVASKRHKNRSPKSCSPHNSRDRDSNDRDRHDNLDSPKRRNNTPTNRDKNRSPRYHSPVVSRDRVEKRRSVSDHRSGSPNRRTDVPSNKGKGISPKSNSPVISRDQVQKGRSKSGSPQQRIDLSSRHNTLPIKKESSNQTPKNETPSKSRSKDHGRSHHSPKRPSYIIHEDNLHTYRAAPELYWPPTKPKDSWPTKKADDIWLDHKLMVALGKTRVEEDNVWSKEVLAKSRESGKKLVKHVVEDLEGARKEKGDVQTVSSVGGGLKETKWALTQVNIFNDGSKSYAVGQPSKQKPAQLPRKTTRVFITVPHAVTRKSQRSKLK